LAGLRGPLTRDTRDFLGRDVYQARLLEIDVREAKQLYGEPQQAGRAGNRLLIHTGTLWFGDDDNRQTEVEASAYNDRLSKLFQTFILQLRDDHSDSGPERFVGGALLAGLASIANDEFRSRWGVFIDHVQLKMDKDKVLGREADVWMLLDVGSFEYGELARAGYQANILLELPEVVSADTTALRLAHVIATALEGMLRR